MKLVKLYLLLILLFFIIIGIMFYHGWFIFGSLLTLVSITNIINYFDILDINRLINPKEYNRRRRIVHFRSLSEEEKEQHLIELHKEAENLSKK